MTGFRRWARACVAIAAITAVAGAGAQVQTRRFDIPSQTLAGALEAFGKQSNREILFTLKQVRQKSSAAVSGEYEPAKALELLLVGSGLRFRQINSETFLVGPGNSTGAEVPP